MKRLLLPLLSLFVLTSCSSYRYSDFYSDTNSYYFDEPVTASPSKTTAPSTEKAEKTTSPEIQKNTSVFENKTIEYENEEKKVEVIDVPFISQEKFPTGCELVSTSMILNFYGMDIEPEDIIKKGYMEVREVKQDPSDYSKKIGGDPNEVFIGSPEKNSGYGCYSGAVYKAMKKYLADKEYNVSNLMGMKLDVMCSRYIDEGIPVLVWATYGMEPSFKIPDNTWTIEGTDEVFTWISHEHCLVLVGYDKEYFYFNDPQKEGVTAYKREDVELRYKELGEQALVITQK